MCYPSKSGIVAHKYIGRKGTYAVSSKLKVKFGRGHGHIKETAIGVPLFLTSRVLKNHSQNRAWAHRREIPEFAGRRIRLADQGGGAGPPEEWSLPNGEDPAYP